MDLLDVAKSFFFISFVKTNIIPYVTHGKEYNKIQMKINTLVVIEYGYVWETW